MVLENFDWRYSSRSKISVLAELLVHSIWPLVFCVLVSCAHEKQLQFTKRLQFTLTSVEKSSEVAKIRFGEANGSVFETSQTNSGHVPVVKFISFEVSLMEVRK